MKGAIAVMSWARRNRLHIGSVYNVQVADPGQEEAIGRVFEEWQEYLAGLGIEAA